MREFFSWIFLLTGCLQAFLTASTIVYMVYLAVMYEDEEDERP